LVARSYNNATTGSYQLIARTELGVNFALNKATFASSYFGSGYEPWRATDGNVDTSWYSGRDSAGNYRNLEYIYVDLGSNREVDTVLVNWWNNAYPSQYVVYVAPNGASAYTEVFRTSGGQSGLNVVRFAVRTARWVMVYPTVRGGTYGYGLKDFGVYDNRFAPLPTVPEDVFDTSKPVSDTVGASSPLPPADLGKDAALSSSGEGGEEFAPLADTNTTPITPTTEFSTTQQPLATVRFAGLTFSSAGISGTASLNTDGTPVLTLIGEAGVISPTTIVAYEWRSSLNGVIATTISATLSTASLTPGAHVLSFRAQDSNGVWSAYATSQFQNGTSVYLPVSYKP
jgi:hypothetical protein